VLSDQKDKLSKSKGNAGLSPEHLLNQYSADVIRYWTASGSLGYDVAFSDNQLKIGQKLVTKLWNAFRFIEMHTVDVAIAKKPITLGSVNEWILTQATHCFTHYQKAFDNYEFSAALNAIERFFWQDFCDNYLELIKDQLFKPERFDAEMVAATRWSLYQVGLRILQMYAPYMPYLTDFLYGALYKKNCSEISLHQMRYAIVQYPYISDNSVRELTAVLSIVAQVRKLKSEQALSLKTVITQLTVVIANDSSHKNLKYHEQLLAGILVIESFVYEHGTQTNFIEQRSNEQWYVTVSV
jgi:valyl-tRNA synthetase